MSQTIIQIGANTGNNPNDPIFKTISNRDQVFLFEPVPFLFEQLKKNYNKQYPSNEFIFEQKAVSNYDGKLNLFVPCESNNFTRFPYWANQLASTNPDHIKSFFKNLKVKQINVSCVSLNTIVSCYNIKNIDFLITDTEGHDFEILYYYNFTVQPKKIRFEHKHIDGIRKQGEKYKKLLDKLYNLNYKLIEKTNQDTILINETC